MKKRRVSGAAFGKWLLKNFIARGGNGEVWSAVNNDGRQGAIKFLRSAQLRGQSRAQRFRFEIEAMQKCADIPGMLPLWDYYLPASQSTDVPWLVSPLAMPLTAPTVAIDSLEEAVRLCRDLAETLAMMHERGVSHRDIKPENILRYNDRWCLGDLGLADFPEKAAITADGERLGPMFYIAPEMLNDSTKSDGAPADVYSLSKLLGKLATGQKYPVPGVHARTEPAHTVSAYSGNERAQAIDAPIESGTQFAPEKRLPMRDFLKSLEAWLRPPAPRQSTLGDLSNLRQRLVVAMRPSLDAAERLNETKEKAADEINRVFRRFAPFMEQVAAALKAIGCTDIRLDGPSGGNANFYRSVTGDETAGTSLEKPTTYFFEHSVTAVVSANSVLAIFVAGVNLGIASVSDSPDVIHDVTAPVRAAVGIIVRAKGGKPRDTQIQFKAGDVDTFRFGQSTEDGVVARLVSVFDRELDAALEQFVRSIEGAS